jgi:hypothetical protein
MIRIAAVALSLTLVGTSSALAQSKSPKAPATDSIATALVGTWEGKYQSDHGAGAFTMVLGHDSAWTASMEMAMPDGSGTIPTKVSGFKVSGSNVTWTQELMGMACQSAAVLAAGTLRGETSCGQGSIGYVLRKK